MDYSALPTLNTFLNGITTILLLTGFVLVKRRQLEAHKKAMIAAAVCSALFLVSYVIYHVNVGSVKYPGTGTIRSVYLTILFTHVVLAAANVPLVLGTLRHAFHDDRERHKRWARITFPIWLYVSVTGIVVYLMLYVFTPRG